MQPDYARSYRTLWERHWWWRSREAYVLGWVRRLHRRAPLGRILDVGCGDGLFFETLSRFGTVHGIEPDASLVSDPRWRSQIHVGTLDRGYPGAGDHDLVLMLDVIEHIADDGEALAAARSVLRPGGHLLVTVPALGWLWSRHDEANAHHRRYDPAQLRSVLTAAGFEVKTVRFFFFWTVAPLVLRRWLRPAGGTVDYAVRVPPATINRALGWLSAFDHALGRACGWPVGSSLLAIARNPERRRVPDARSRPDFPDREVALPRDPRRIEGSSDSPSLPLSEPLSP